MAFEAVMRLGSMTAAARELDSTQPAISQRVRALEEAVGIPLFERHGSRLHATAEGQRYYADIADAVRGVSAATRRLQSGALTRRRKLTIAAHFGMAHLWLLPLLSRLEAAFPATRFEIMPVDQDDSPEMDAADLTIRFGQFDTESPGTCPLFAEVVYPVCSCEFAARHGLVGTVSPEHLRQLPLLHMDHQDPRWLDWYRWCEIANLPPPAGPPRFAYNNYPLLLNAATNGEGLALGWDALVRPLVRKQTLIRLAPVVRRDNRGYLLCARHPELVLVASVIRWFQQAGSD